MLTRKQYIEKQVEECISHFGDSETYKNELVSRKMRYLMPHLKALNVPSKVAVSLLIKLESRQNEVDDTMVREEELEEEAIASGEEEDNDFEMTDDNHPNDVEMNCDEDSDTISRTEYELEVVKILSKSDSELFEDELDVSDQVRRSNRYIERKRKYTERYVEDQLNGLNSQDILSTFSQNPVAVQESNALNEKLKHLSKQERANRTIHKSLQDTIDALKKTPGKDARNQVKIVTAAASHHRWGTPDFEGVSWRTAKEAKGMKIDLLKGNQSVLKPDNKERKRVYPKELEDLAVRHWNENTMLKPAMHRRRAETDDKETVPTRYQSLTNNEQYSLFKEDCKDDIENILRKYSIEEIDKLGRRPNSDEKVKRLAYFASLQTKVPSIDWFLNLKPAEVKAMHDHTTALCKICESTALNYATIVKTLKTYCKCGTTMCPNWLCLCELSDDEYEGEQCRCKCECDDCTKCKVNYSQKIFK